jgi:2-methylisocitrate lyase-like PEP mutase family enzyme
VDPPASARHRTDLSSRTVLARETTNESKEEQLMAESPTLRELIGDPQILVAMGAHDPLTALIAQRAGFDALYHGGYAVAAHHHGLPDIGIVGLAEMVESLRRVTGVSATPVMADCDTGYGDVPSVKRVVMEMEAAGAAAVQIEDQVFPKRCGHLDGKRVIPSDDMVAKIRAAAAARRSPETLIIARTDSLQPLGLDEAIDRCNTYAEAGADLLFVDAPRTVEQLAEIARRVDAPSLANMSETGRTPALSAGELQELGYRVVIFPATQTWTIAHAVETVCREVRQHGTTRGFADRLMPFEELNELLGISRWEAVESDAAQASSAY